MNGELLIIVDIEADGPIPGIHSMLSFGAVAMVNGTEQAEFYEKLTPLEGAAQDDSTMVWWRSQPEAWTEATSGAIKPQHAIEKFANWINEQGADPIFVAHPTGYDYAFINWYFYKFVGSNPFTNKTGAPRTLDVQSYVAGKFGYSFERSSRSGVPAMLLQGVSLHTHKAIDDAKAIAGLLRNATSA